MPINFRLPKDNKPKSATPRYKRMLRKQAKGKKMAPKYRKRLLACKPGKRHLRFI